MELTYVVCPAWPDAAELRMLRALVAEGVTVSRSRAYSARFHGWHIHVWRAGGPLGRLPQIEIRCPDGALCVRTWRWVTCGLTGEVFP
ncbi:hypothetical protein FEP90_05132 [Burkholderia multivorans]|nr:hypothetical protein [Burkholderia multivorans]MDR8769017.1 hypothetical protein [Burkholderia multivorans]MDR8774986.1 hypothetical protein [Burkholderia multivorans]MDR8792543.1 hypothetical protein [Burkholderia multivorans]MDR8798598.1 hypothetical protein [Burkholderia multivorans]